MLWRTYVPPTTNIRLIKTLPMDCYMCGKSGHLGPECGLYRGPGNPTFSKENHLRYVSASGSTQAMGTGKDYTIPPRKKSGINIKGMANDVINLDSDEEMEDLIHAKVRPPPHRGNIQVSNINRGTDVRSAFTNERNAPMPPTRYANESSRYGRERTFSPPPRYEGRNDFPAFDDRRNGPARNQTYIPPPLPRGPPPRGPPPGNGGRGGGRGGLQSRMETRLPPKPPPASTGGKQRKPRNRRGKS